jgi:20S proteasome alpha/beta subunit
MTTLIGLLASKGIVLFSDTQVMEDNIKCPQPARKIYTIYPHCAVGFSGNYVKSQELGDYFKNKLKIKNEKDLLKCLSQGFLANYDSNFENLNLVVGIYSENPYLFCVNRNGLVKRKKKSVILGSGSKYARDYLSRNLKSKKNLSSMIKLGYSAERFAFQDTSTGGFVNYVIITEEGVDKFGLTLNKKQMDLEKNYITESISKYSS